MEVPAAAAKPAPKPAPLSRLWDGIERRPRAAFAGFLALHFAVWTALPALLYANLPLDLIEALIYGSEWQLGYDKLPPLPWWLVEIAHRLFGTDAAYYALAQACVVIAFALVFATARPLVGTVGALAAVLIIDGMHYFQYTAVKFNHDVIQLPFWALAGYAFHAALKRGRLEHWVLLGVAFGGALWAKYFVVMLAVPYVLFMLLDRQARPALATPGPWLALRRRARHRLTAPGLAVSDRFPALRLCQPSGDRGARLVRSPAASGHVHSEPDFLPAAVAVHRRGVVLAETETPPRPAQARMSPTCSTAASSRSSPSGRRWR